MRLLLKSVAAAGSDALEVHLIYQTMGGGPTWGFVEWHTCIRVRTGQCSEGS